MDCHTSSFLCGSRASLPHTFGTDDTVVCHRCGSVGVMMCRRPFLSSFPSPTIPTTERSLSFLLLYSHLSTKLMTHHKTLMYVHI